MPAPRRRKTPPLDQLVRTPSAVTRIQKSRTSLYRLEADGLLTRYKIGATVYWDVAELDALVVRGRGAA